MPLRLAAKFEGDGGIKLLVAQMGENAANEMLEKKRAAGGRGKDTLCQRVKKRTEDVAFVAWTFFGKEINIVLLLFIFATKFRFEEMVPF